MAYIVGYIDGDGCISHDKSRIQLIGTKSVLEWIKSWFDCWCLPSGKRKCAVVTNRGKYYLYGVSGYRAKYLISKMLALDVPMLERKWK